MFQSHRLTDVPVESDGGEVAVSYPPLVYSTFRESTSSLHEDSLELYGYRFKHDHLHALEWVCVLSLDPFQPPSLLSYPMCLIYLFNLTCRS